jgi:hypothetical protein
MTRQALHCLLSLALFLSASIAVADTAPVPSEQRMLYVAVPGIRDELMHGGCGVLVFDIDHDHKFLRRITLRADDAPGHPDAMKGICASAVTKRLYFSTTKSLTCIDLLTDKILWEKKYAGGCDRMSIAPDGKTIYLPSLEGDHWNIVDAEGELLNTITLHCGAHNTVFAIDGKHVYLAGLKSKILTIADASTRQAVATVGPFGGNIRPFTVNGSSTLCYCCVNGLLGFEIGDLATGKLVERVAVEGFPVGPVKRHGCPSHGIAMTPDESEIWLSDGHNQLVHVFDATVMPPKLKSSIPLRDQPGWITFSIDGKLAYASTGEVIDAGSKKVITALKDENGQDVASEKLLEIDFRSGVPSRAGDQFGRGQKP